MKEYIARRGDRFYTVVVSDEETRKVSENRAIELPLSFADSRGYPTCIFTDKREERFLHATLVSSLASQTYAFRASRTV